MADFVSVIVSQASENNVTENVNNTTGKVPATPEGMAIAYGSLVIMALIPIFFGAFRSIRHHKDKIKDTMTSRDAAMFPIIASCALFGLYIIFKIFSKEYINLLLTGYFFFLGVLALTHISSPIVSKLVPAAVPNIPFHILFRQGEGEKSEDIINYKFSSYDVVTLVFCSLIGAWYLLKKHWIANNLFGMAFAINGVELLHLNNVVTGFILLSGLFVYDIFWVFGTDVMVTVAKSFEAPIKLVFPQDLLTNGFNANNFAMLGLGDIVVPGIFIALLLRFDRSLNRKSDTYFYTTFVAYLFGLMATIFIMHVFKHAQPALLYLVPACLGTPLVIALIKGDLSAMFKYEDVPENSDDDSKKEVKATSEASSTSKKVK